MSDAAIVFTIFLSFLLVMAVLDIVRGAVGGRSNNPSPRPPGPPPASRARPNRKVPPPVDRETNPTPAPPRSDA